MGEIRPWQIGVFILAIVAVGAAVWYTFMANDPGRHLEKSVLLVDVENGQLWRVSTKRRGIILPAESPDTGRYSLFTAEEDEDGTYRVMVLRMEGLRRAVERGEIDADKLVADLETGRFEPVLPIKRLTRD